MASVKDQEYANGAPDFDNAVGSENWACTTFTSGVGVTSVSLVKVFMKRVDTPNDIVYCDIFAADGAHKPTGGSLGQAQVAAFADAGYVQKTFTFGTPVVITASTEYVIVISSPASDPSVYNWAGDSGGDYAGGQLGQSSNSGGSWNSYAAYDGTFETWYLLPPPVVDTFTATPATMDEGDSSTLAWTTSEATSVSIDNGIGVVAVDGSTVVSPTVPTTYTLTATGPGGTTTATANVTVTAAPPTPEPSGANQADFMRRISRRGRRTVGR